MVDVVPGLFVRAYWQGPVGLRQNMHDQADIEKSKVENILKLYAAGLLGKDEASIKAGELI